MKDDDLNDFIHNNNLSINIEEFKQYLDFIINIIRTVPAVYYSEITNEEKEKYFAYRKFNNYITLIKPKEKICLRNDKDISNSIFGLISTNKKSNKLEEYTQKLFNLNKEKADELIKNIWEAFKDEKILKEYDDKNQLYSLWADRFDLHRYSDTKWFFCQNCRKITRFNAKNICPNCFEQNKLEEINPNEKLENNYYRFQYTNKKIEKLVYQEHTAQLSNEKAAKIQKNFKNKQINYLSCSTTFEMGIDIGSLENVLLRNVPPSPANYIQRAGRAGRSQDSSAFILTYCSNNSHDYTFFEKPLRMIDAQCNTPVFKMQNNKIMYRHLIAMSLSEFFKNNNSAFTNVKSFYLDGWFDKFIQYLQSKPSLLINSTNAVLSSTEGTELMQGKWIDNVLNDKEDDIKISKVNFKSLWEELQNEKTLSYDRKDHNGINYYERLINIIEQDKNLIKKLADSNLIPKYGFPTDLVELRINDINIKTDDYELIRDMKIALSEYAPGSEIMVDKKVITSQYINRVKELPITYYYECDNCHKTILKEYAGVIKCPNQTCNNEINKNAPFFITPTFGFTGELKSNTQNQLKPKRSYSSPLKYVGNGVLDGKKVRINDYLEFYNSKNDEILIVNENNFFICNECGYAIIEKSSQPLNKKIKEHKALYHECSNNELTKQSLGFLYKTDVLKMVLNIPFENGENEAISVLYAILEGIALAFDIERNDIDGIYINEEGRQVFVLFDTFPGGAGHVKRLLDIQEMEKAFEYAYEKVSQNCCDTSCYSCIRNWKNQKYHEYLNRILAKNYLDKLIKTFNNNNNVTNN